MVKLSKPSSPVFPHLVDKTATVDKIVVSVTGKLKEHFCKNELLNVKRESIFHPGDLYGGCIFAQWGMTKNSVLVHHGRLVRFKNVPPQLVTMHSETIPVTAAQIKLFIKSCMEEDPGPVISVSSLELTFDVTDAEVEYIRQNLIHRAQGGERSLFDEWSNQTIYVGSPRSAWQVRIYQKKPMGRAHGIHSS